MKIERLKYDLTVCKVQTESDIDKSMEFYAIGKTDILANHQIGIFVVSTYNTDYILVKGEDFDRALALLEAEGYTVV